MRYLLMPLSLVWVLLRGKALITGASTPSLLKAHALKQGDCIGVMSPSGAFSGRQAMWQRMEAFITGQGYKLRVGQHAQEIHGYLSGTDEQKVADFHSLWDDPEVKAIWCSQGGYGSMRMLAHLDYDKLRQNPKLLIGYSDVSALLWAVHGKTGLVVFHGPMAVSDFGLPPEMLSSYSWQHLEAMVTGALTQQESPYLLENAYAGSYQCIKAGEVEGPLYATNLQLLTTLLGTPYFPDLRGAILLVEDIASYIYIVDRMLTQLKLAGVFDQLGALIFGEFLFIGRDHPIIPLNTQGAPTEMELCRELAWSLPIPSGYGFSSGHGLDKTTIPMGCRARFDATAGQLTLLETPVQRAG